MKILVGQTNPTTGDIRGNLDRIRACLKDGRRADADLAVFPAWALTGYEPRDLAREAGFLRRQQNALAGLVECSGDLPVLVGHADSKGTGRCVVSHIWDGRCRRIGGVGAPGWVRIGDVRLGFTVEGLPDKTARDCDHLLSLEPRPFRLLEHGEWAARCAERARRKGAPLLHVNLVGGNGEAVFAGGSALFDAQGRRVARAARFAADSPLFDTQETGHAPAGSVDEVADLHAALKLGLAEFLHKNGFRDAVLGLSGGLDSAVVAALAADALGPDRLAALVMPTRFSSIASVQAAEQIAANLGIECRMVEIERLRQEFEAALVPVLGGTERGTAEENIQARIRGAALMAYANKYDAMTLATGNRSELAVGYCTLYGDMAGGLAVIGDIPKTWVHRLAQHINREEEIIPPFVIERPPSAELKPGQTDQDDLPPYDVLDGILELLLDERLDEGEIAQRGFEQSLVADVAARVKQSAFKRRQAAPALQVYSRGCPWPRLPTAGMLVVPRGEEALRDG